MRRSIQGLITLQEATRRYRAGGAGLKLTLLVLVEHMGCHDGEWSCWPSMQSLAEQTEQTPGTVRRHVADFEALGLVSREVRGRRGGGRGSNRFILDVDLLLNLADQSDQIARFASEQTDDDARFENADDAGQTAHAGGGKARTEESEMRALPPDHCLIGTVERFVKNGESATVVAEAPSEIDVLCDLLASRIERHRGGDRPAIPTRWRRDMRLLLERGPLKVVPAPMTVDAVANAIAAVFDDLADPDTNGFCWADQVRSPASLRRHLPDIRQSWKRVHRQRSGVKPGIAAALDDLRTAEG